MEPNPLFESNSPEFDFLGAVKAGFPSPAESIREHLDLLITFGEKVGENIVLKLFNNYFCPVIFEPVGLRFT